jgi:hypothetical protein
MHGTQLDALGETVRYCRDAKVLADGATDKTTRMVDPLFLLLLADYSP